jgi:hypothetical protein
MLLRTALMPVKESFQQLHKQIFTKKRRAYNTNHIFTYEPLVPMQISKELFDKRA